VDEPALAHVDADVVHKQATAERKEHKVTGQQLAAIQRQALLALFHGRARQAQAQLLMHVECKSGTVKPGWAIATVAIGLPEQCLRELRQALAPGRLSRTCSASDIRRA
jgi:hypothetical protein